MTLNTGLIINGRYRIAKLLGEGGFGAVYQAWDLNLDQLCALKMNLDTSQEAQRQFQKEAAVLAKLSHPNLPRVTDRFFVQGQGQFLVMDFVDGEDLESMMSKGAIQPEQAIEWIGQVADALNYLHSQPQPIIHRDIKPANIRVTPNGRAVLVDFGLVKVYDAHLKTTIGARAVTPGYSPPEQYGRGSTDAQTDIYALAATLYTLLTREEPPESIQRIVEDTLKPVTQVNSGVGAEVEQAIVQAMSLTPSQRYTTVLDFTAALQEVKKPEPGAATRRVQTIQPEPIKPQKEKPTVPAWIWFVAGAIVIALLFFGGSQMFDGDDNPVIVERTATSVAEIAMATDTPTSTVTGAPTDTSTPQPTNTPKPTSTRTPTPRPTNASKPTSTRTLTPQPTATKTPTHTPHPTSTAVATLIPQSTLAPATSETYTDFTCVDIDLSQYEVTPSVGSTITAGGDVVFSWPSINNLPPEYKYEVNVYNIHTGRSIRQTTSEAQIAITLDRGEHRWNLFILDPTGEPVPCDDGGTYLVYIRIFWYIP